VADNLAAVALGDDVFQFHTPPHYATGLDIRCPCERFTAEIGLPADAAPPILFDNQMRSGKTVIDRRKYSSDVRGRA
jgi:hypothetical protein